MNLKPVKETEYGLYIWMMPDGSVVKDEEDNFMCIASREGDFRKIKLLQDAAKSFGIEVGRAFFLPGRRKVDNEEFERQKARLEAGLIPDEYDAAAWAEEIRNR